MNLPKNKRYRYCHSKSCRFFYKNYKIWVCFLKNKKNRFRPGVSSPVPSLVRMQHFFWKWEQNVGVSKLLNVSLTKCSYFEWINFLSFSKISLKLWSQLSMRMIKELISSHGWAWLARWWFAWFGLFGGWFRLSHRSAAAYVNAAAAATNI